MNPVEDAPFAHRPVMLDEIVELLGAPGPGILVDATLGGAGHAAGLLAANPDLVLIGIDRDPSALAAAAGRLASFESRVQIRRARFDTLETEVERAKAAFPGLGVTAVLFDLGVSSPQLDRAARGFSYRSAGPLDMRMDPSQGLTASDVVNTYDERALVALFRANGEGRFATRIARAMIAARPVTDTVTLAAIIRDAIPAPARRRGGHPAKRVFQAIRVEVNAELDVLRPALEAAMAVVAPGGRVAVLSYHSGEDRIVKQAFLDVTTGGCTCPPGLPCVCGASPAFRLVFRGSRTPTPVEITGNPRAESARLRAVERLPSVDTAAAQTALSGETTRDERSPR